MLPREWEGINGLYEKSEDEIRQELCRELDEWAKTNPYEDNLMGAYTPAEFEEEFNGNDGDFNGSVYFVKFYENGKSVL